MQTRSGIRLLGVATVAELVAAGLVLSGLVTSSEPVAGPVRHAAVRPVDAKSSGVSDPARDETGARGQGDHGARMAGGDHDRTGRGHGPAGTAAWGTPSFAAPRDFATGAIPTSVAFNTASGDQTIPLGATHLLVSNSVAVGDFDEDGHDDVVETNVVAGSMSVFLGDGNGGFAAPVISPTGGLPSFVVAGRLDLDDHLDLAVAHLGSSDVAILHGDGHGRFGVADRVPVPGPRHVAIGDLEGDGVPDLAVASAGPACPPPASPPCTRSPAGAVVILGGVRGPSGTVTFKVVQVLRDTSSLDGEPVSPAVVALVDLNGDRQDDVAAASGFRRSAGDALPGGGVTGDDVFVRLHRPRPATGGDPFDPAPSQPGLRVGGSPEGIAVGDFNRDSHPDLAVLGNASGDVTTLLGSATGRLSVKVRNATVGMVPRSLVTADLDGDGLLDLVTAGFGASTAGVLAGRGDGTFAASVDHWIGDGPTSVAVGRFDGDRRPDVVAGRIRGDALTLLLNRGRDRGDGVVIARDQPYLPAAGDPFAAHHMIDVYAPPPGTPSFAGRGKRYPVISFFHGGGLQTNKTMYALVLRHLAGAGFVVASADYRRDPGGPQAPDVATALRWTIAHASAYNADPGDVTVVAHSGGMVLAMAVLAAPENADILRHVKAFVATSGITYDAAQNARAVLSGRPAGGAAVRALLINGTDGFELGIVAQSVAFNAVLRAEGADIRHCIYAGRDHFTATSHLALDHDPVSRALEQFLRAEPVDCPI